ncbi:hypothetical protein OAS89_03635 [Alphaproteobacteria bacterium]|nr:hypothetical protein [Alphaproteobacteria bacterium]
MGEDESEQPLTEHLVDQFASYFLITMVAFHLVGYLKKHYGKRHLKTGHRKNRLSENHHIGKRRRDDV